MLLGDSTIDSKVCQEASVGNVLRQYIRESHVVGECLDYVTNEVDQRSIREYCLCGLY